VRQSRGPVSGIAGAERCWARHARGGQPSPVAGGGAERGGSVRRSGGAGPGTVWCVERERGGDRRA
jgi:hypothetical protein